MQIPNHLYVLENLYLFFTPDNWIQDFQAEDTKGRPISPNDPKACKFCLMGKINNIFDPFKKELRSKMRKEKGREHTHTDLYEILLEEEKKVYTYLKYKIQFCKITATDLNYNQGVVASFNDRTNYSGLMRVLYEALNEAQAEAKNAA